MHKGLTLFILLVVNSYSATAQHNVIKGIGAGWPMRSGGVYTVGVGYERIIGDHLSMQLYFNHKGHQLAIDGGKSTYNSLIPEVRYYFKCQPDFSSSFFLAPFVELQRRTDGGGGERDYNDYYVQGVQKQVSPGLLMGKNFRLSVSGTLKCTWARSTGSGMKQRNGL